MCEVLTLLIRAAIEAVFLFRQAHALAEHGMLAPGREPFAPEFDTSLGRAGLRADLRLPARKERKQHWQADDADRQGFAPAKADPGKRAETGSEGDEPAARSCQIHRITKERHQRGASHTQKEIAIHEHEIQPEWN